MPRNVHDEDWHDDTTKKLKVENDELQTELKNINETENKVSKTLKMNVKQN